MDLNTDTLKLKDKPSHLYIYKKNPIKRLNNKKGLFTLFKGNYFIIYRLYELSSLTSKIEFIMVYPGFNNELII